MPRDATRISRVCFWVCKPYAGTRHGGSFSLAGASLEFQKVNEVSLRSWQITLCTQRSHFSWLPSLSLKFIRIEKIQKVDVETLQSTESAATHHLWFYHGSIFHLSSSSACVNTSINHLPKTASFMRNKLIV